MPSKEFKAEINKRFSLFFNYLQDEKGFVRNTDIAKLMGISIQSLSQLLSGDRIITVEQMSNLVKSTSINIEWLLTGAGTMLKELKPQKAAIKNHIDNNIDLSKIIEEKDRLWNLVEELREEKHELKNELTLLKGKTK